MEHLTLDLALEMQERLQTPPDREIEGLRTTIKNKDNMTVTAIEVLDNQGAQRIGKPVGTYVTIEAPGLRQKNPALYDSVSDALGHELRALFDKINIQKQAKVFVVGLGNRHVTPDALGPFVIDQLLVTRHIFETMPNEVSPGYREVSALAPDVYGKTGVETSDIIRSITSETKPDLVICIDALASRAMERVTTTIQLTTTGIHPGSGVGNHRKGLSLETLGIPVIAIGVPTVVYASTIVATAIDDVLQTMQTSAHRGSATFYAWTDLPEQQRHQLVKKALTRKGDDLIVTPKLIDEYIEDLSQTIADGINLALHDALQ
jgi:spore protease